MLRALLCLDRGPMMLGWGCILGLCLFMVLPELLAVLWPES